MNEFTYPKILTMFRRDPENNNKTLLEGQWAHPAFEYLAKNEWVWTEKVDGTNIRVLWDGCRARFFGRTGNAQIPPFLEEELKKMFPPSLFEYHNMPPMILYGEGYGARIQKGGGNYIPDGVSFILFDVFIDGWWLERENIEDIAGKLGIKVVPIYSTGALLEGYEFVRHGIVSQLTPKSCWAEGLVMKPKVDMLARSGNRIITKIKSKDFGK